MLPAQIVRTAVVGALFLTTLASAAEPNCGQKLVDGFSPPTTLSYIYPRHPVTPFYQWENNDGYCGEVSMMQAGLNNGQWMSQFNARLVCGAGLSQSGPDGACAAHHNEVNNNAQLLLETPGTGVSGPDTYAAAPLCLSNSRLSATTFNYLAESPGIPGYQEFMSWVKQETIAGHQVTVGVLYNGESDAQYDHEVTVIKIGTNHSPVDPKYYPDDVLYLDDHGAYTLSGRRLTNYPAIPPGAGADSTGCTPYVFGYTFSSLPRTRSQANQNSAPAYSIVIPGAQTIQTWTGASGYGSVAIHGPNNYGFSVAGPEDAYSETLPTAVTIVESVISGMANPLDPVAGHNYENPMIGTSLTGDSCTNQRPAAMAITLQATVSGLIPGVSYNLYEFDFSSITGTGAGAALAVPVKSFNANAKLATRVTRFTATGYTFTQTVTTTSDKVVVFRCVPSFAL